MFENMAFIYGILDETYQLDYKYWFIEIPIIISDFEKRTRLKYSNFQVSICPKQLIFQFKKIIFCVDVLI